MKALPVQRADQICARPEPQRWLIQELWAEQAVGIVGGEPKCFKSFLALDMAVSIASGTPCLRHFHVHRTGPVLLFPAEDALPDVRARLDGICAAAGLSIQQLPLYLITAPRLALDQIEDRLKLQATIATLRPILLILDPLIRLHTGDENQACDIAPILSFLRALQRRFALAVTLVHHARKDAHGQRPGQALRGSSELHGWGDSNLYLRRDHLPGRQAGERLTLAIEHRCAPSRNGIPLQLRQQGPAIALSLCEPDPSASCPQPPPPSDPDRILQLLAAARRPLSLRDLRPLCRIRTQTLSQILSSLLHQNRIQRTPQGYLPAALCSQQPHHTSPPSVSRSSPSIAPAGNGNRKHPPLCLQPSLL